MNQTPQYNIYGRHSTESFTFLKAFAKKHGEKAAVEYAQSIADRYDQPLEFTMNGARIGQSYTSSSAESLNFLTDTLTHIDLEAREQMYASSNRWSRFIPIMRGIPRGANRVQFQLYDYSGRARPVSHDGRDFPAANIVRRTDDMPLLDNGISVQYTLPELESAQFQGISLDQKGLRAAAMGINNYREITWFEGDSLLGTDWQRGLTNLAITGDDAVAHASISGNSWDHSSPPDSLTIANQIMGAIHTLIEGTNEIIGTMITGDIVVALPTVQHRIVHERPISTTYPKTRIADWVKESSIWKSYYPQGEIMFQPLRELKQAGSSNADRMCVYVKSDDVLFASIVIDSERLEVERTNTLFRIPIRSRISPLYVATPKGIVYRDGI